MTFHPLARIAAAILAALASSQAIASGGGGGYDAFINRSAPDIALNRYQSGELGVVLPTYERMYLYTAWRTVMLGAADVKAAPNPPGALQRAVGSRTAGWIDSDEGRKVFGAWQSAIEAALKQAPAAPKEGNNLAFGYLNCPVSSYDFATATLTGLTKRSDATAARLNAWIKSQKQVFKACGDDPDAPRERFNDGKRVVEAPPELPASEALYWRQMQQYQLASAAFYGENYALSSRLFAQIGATDKHPLRSWGDYLSLRSQARAATFFEGDKAVPQWQIKKEAHTPARLAAAKATLDGIKASAEHILANPELASLHEASRAIVRSMQVRLTPDARFAELSKLLDDPRANPYLDDHLGDWRVLANDYLEAPTTDTPDTRARLRKDVAFIDWMQTVHQCLEYQAKASCADERAHATDQWRHFNADGNKGMARVWLLATAMLSEAMPAEIEQAALKVPVSAPEYLSLRFALARHYRINRQAAQARAAGDAVLASASLAASNSTSARNLFLQERFAVATSPADAANYLLRKHSSDLDPDTGEVKAVVMDEKTAQPIVEPAVLAGDSLRWLNGGLTVADLSALAANPKLDQATRIDVGVAAWMRADLLGQDEAALKAAQMIGQDSPALAPVMRQYQALASAPERRHLMLLSAVRYGLSPMIRNYRGTEGIVLRDSDSMLADQWCKIAMQQRPDSDGWQYDGYLSQEHAPPMADTGNSAARDLELAQLGKLKTSTGFLGDYVMQRAAAVPNDPDLPWLLHVVVQSTKGGCLDPDASALSKKAFALLHKRFPRNEWTRKTPYFY